MDPNRHAPSPFSIRVAVPGDRPAVGHLLESSYAVLLRGHYPEPLLQAALPLLTRANRVLLASGTFLVAESNEGRMLGCGGWTRERPGRGDVTPQLGHIRHFATDPEHARRGIGRAIYETCEQQARNAGITRFECYAGLNAEGFYAALGFERIETLDVRLDDHVALPAIRMARPV